MGLFSINIPQMVRDLFPRSKRTDEDVALGSGLLSGVGRSATILEEYREGTAAPAWSAGTYNRYDQVVYERAVYECIVDSTTAVPDVSADWQKIADFALGADEMQYYDGSKIGLEYALNRYFGTTYTPPPGTPDIYIQNNTITDPVFRAGVALSDSSAVGLSGSTEYVPLTYTATAAQPLFTIWVPVAFHTALGADADQIISNFADRYVVAGITYNIDTY